MGAGATAAAFFIERFLVDTLDSKLMERKEKCSSWVVQVVMVVIGGSR